MSAGLGNLPPGSPPSPRWWRPYRDVPLIVLGILSVIAAVVGWTVQYRLDSAASAPAAVSPSGSPAPEVAAACAFYDDQVDQNFSQAIVLVIETAERHLVNAPAATSGYG